MEGYRVGLFQRSDQTLEGMELRSGEGSSAPDEEFQLAKRS